MLTREQLISADTKRYVDVETIAGVVRLGVMSSKDRDEYLSIFLNSVDAAEGRDLSPKHILLSKCIVGEDGKRLFSDDETDIISSKSSDFIDVLVKAANELNGLTRQANEGQKNV